MRIIEENEQEYIKKCKCCGSKFGYKKTELECIWNEFYIRCPICKTNQKTSIFDKKAKEEEER